MEYIPLSPVKDLFYTGFWAMVWSDVGGVSSAERDGSVKKSLPVPIQTQNFHRHHWFHRMERFHMNECLPIRIVWAAC